MSYLHPKARLGLELFNRGEYFEAHEALEEAWREEPSELRGLYKGILQVAVAYLHIGINNYEGAVKLHARSQKWLTPWPELTLGIDVGQLRRDFEVVIAEVRRLGPGNLDKFNRVLFKKISYEPENE